MKSVLLALLTAHLIGDFVLQSSAQVEGKQAGRLRSFAAHGAIHWIIALVLVSLFVPRVVGSWTTQFVLLLLVCGHLALDACKVWLDARALHRKVWHFLADQLAHVLLIVVAAAATGGISLFAFLEPLRSWLIAHREPVLTGGALYLAVIFAGGFLIQLLLTPFRPSQRSEAAKVEAGGESSRGGHGMPNAGMYIGWLERAIVMSAIVVGEHTLVGFVIAAKAIIRFKETDLDFAEYFLLGTFLSLLLAGAGAILFRAFVDPIPT